MDAVISYTDAVATSARDHGVDPSMLPLRLTVPDGSYFAAGDIITVGASEPRHPDLILHVRQAARTIATEPGLPPRIGAWHLRLAADA